MRGGVLLDPVTGRATDEHGLKTPGIEAVLKLASPTTREYLRRAAEPGGPRASRQYFRELLDPVQLTASPNGSAITTATETALWTTSTYSALVANQVRVGQVWKVTAMGQLTSGSTASPNITITPRWGTTTSGTSLGASAATSGVVSITNGPFLLQMLLTINSVGATGTAVCNGTFETSTCTRDITFGGTLTTIDTTVASGLFAGITISVTGWSLTTRSVFMEALN